MEGTIGVTTAGVAPVQVPVPPAAPAEASKSMTHFNALQAGVIAAVTQAITLGVAFGVLNSTVEGTVIAAATSMVNAAFLIANSIHDHAHSK